MNVVMIIPTGIGCEIGGHAGDATPAARLLAKCCKILIVHPNVVNASDINEMTSNMWYVEGSMLDRFLRQEIDLRKPDSNRILLVVNKIKPEIVNAVSAARATLGINALIVELNTPLKMKAIFKPDGRAGGEIFGWRELVEQVESYDFDALAVNTVIDCEKEVALRYFKESGVNPWGGVEAMASKLLSDALNKPVAHAPVESGNLDWTDYEFVSDPRMAAEMVSTCYLHCVLKGLHQAPRIENNSVRLRAVDIDCLISPYKCWGEPHIACQKLDIPIIAVKENTCILSDKQPECIFVENYVEAAGLLMAMQAGVSLASVRRPLKNTVVSKADR